MFSKFLQTTTKRVLGVLCATTVGITIYALSKKTEAQSQNLNINYFKMASDKFNTIGSIPREYLTDTFCYEILFSDNVNTIDSVPKEYLTDEFYHEILKKNKNFIKKMPLHLLTQNICDETIRAGTHHLFRYIPDQFKSDELCLRSIIYDKNNWQFLPESKKNMKITDGGLDNLIKKGYHDIQIDAGDLLSDESWHIIVGGNHMKIFNLPKDKLNYKFIEKYSDRPNFIDYVKCYIELKIYHQNEDFYRRSTSQISNRLQKTDLMADLISEIPKNIFSQLTPNDFSRMLLTGSQFKKYFPKLELTKITSTKGLHDNFAFDAYDYEWPAETVTDPRGVYDNFRFKPGYIYDEEFDASSTSHDGLYFTENRNINKWSDLYECHQKCHLFDVEIFDDSVVKIEKNKFKTNRFILSNFREWTS